MIRNTALGIGLAILSVFPQITAADEKLSEEARSLLSQAVNAAFHAATACYSVQHLVFSSIEAKSRGANKEAVLAAAASRVEMRPELYEAIDLAFEVERVTDRQVGDFFEKCLQETRAEILEVVQE